VLADRELLLTLHGLRLVGFAGVEVVADRAGLAVDVTAATLSGAADRGWVAFRSGRMTGWSLTVTGRAHGQSLLVEEARHQGAVDEIAAVYQRFSVLNPRFLVLCTEWQLRPDPTGERVLNQHSDPGYDASVLGRLAELHAETAPLADRLGALLDRFTRYRGRLDHAHDRVQTGELDWFVRPVIDSYHTVWFELHEDLLATLGLERVDERR